MRVTGAHVCFADGYKYKKAGNVMPAAENPPSSVEDEGKAFDALKSGVTLFVRHNKSEIYFLLI